MAAWSHTVWRTTGRGTVSGDFLAGDRRAHYEEHLLTWRKRRARAQRVAGQVEVVLRQCGGSERRGRSKEGEKFCQRAL